MAQSAGMWRDRTSWGIGVYVFFDCRSKVGYGILFVECSLSGHDAGTKTIRSGIDRCCMLLMEYEDPWISYSTHGYNVYPWKQVLLDGHFENFLFFPLD